MKKTTATALVGVKEIARRANVSIGTVDRVLNNRSGVAAKTRERVLEIIKELDYQPNMMARRLASRRSWQFAVLIPAASTETGYWNAPLQGIKQAANEIRDFGVTVQVFFFDQNDKTTFTTEANNIIKQGFDGVLFAPMFEEESLKLIKKCHSAQIPYVFINSDMEGQDRLSYIGPDLYQSGYLAAHLINYMVQDQQQILIVNISKEMGHHHHLLKKEDGFRAYFRSNKRPVQLLKTDIRQTDYQSVKSKLTKTLKENKVDVIFVTNSRVATVARFLEEAGHVNIRLMGYDFLAENIEYLEKSVIDFLICQKPQEQGHKGIMALYNSLVLGLPVEEIQHMPIDIITRENYHNYRN
ncbi:LacI family transcriptional regulator [Chitinophaga terrae (ex Kim and Jung 2007)]|uniref:LacI family DNA-binding transcriptional regulator n=1 Tax=Chitinophaga terrae (ex Kim and Jung 2007) TaxID=408074 RepID=UPI00278A1424|nr:LacI family DNA-binding transcriptional regulator [Chitinophaga terrae (ex Kim and Jung 2007)]MDQ0104929.1 LacI family transcriptional regulator [Chitinophaga terrae (ex Kim and Jung 2007)]